MPVTLDKTDAAVNLSLSEDCLTATPLISGSLSQLWSGVRANSSASAGKVFFVVKVVRDLSGDGEEVQPESLIGVSTRGTAASQLGCGSSWAYASSGQKVASSKAESFGVTYSVGDRIGCFLDLESKPCTLSFSHNEKWLGHAFDLQQPDQSQQALYPHILLKGVEVEVDFSAAGNKIAKEASEYKPWMVAVKGDGVSAPSTSKTYTQAECEVMVMVGLPGSGKSTWAERYIANHPEKRYTLLSIDGIIKQLKLASSQPRGKQKIPDAKSQPVAEQAYKELLDHLEEVPRNYILDDSNVYEAPRSALVSKLRKAGFRTRAAVIVLPDSSLFRRQRKQHQEEGKSVPETTIADMRANFSMPEVGDVFQEVFFVEAKPPEAHDIAAAQAEAAKAALPMLKARSAGGRQTRSRTAKATPKRASVTSKKDAEDKTSEAGGNSAVANGSAADAPDVSDGPHSTPDKASISTAPVNSDNKDTAADSIMADVSQTAPTDGAMVSTDTLASPKPDPSAAAGVTDSAKQAHTDVEQEDTPVSMGVDADKTVSEPAASPAAPEEAVEAAAEEAVEAAADDIITAEGTEAPVKPAVSQQGTEEIVLSQEGDGEPSIAAEPKEEVQAEQADPAKEEEQADAAEQVKQEPEANTAEASMAAAEPETKAKAKDENTETEQKAETSQKADTVHKDNSPAGPVSNAKDTAEPESRGVKRPAPAVTRGAKHARTNQAAGRLLGNIRNQGPVKRTVIRGRVGARPAGMRLPPPMSPDGAAPAKVTSAVKATSEAKDNLKDDKQERNEDAAKTEDKAGANFKDVMQQLLPAEQDSKVASPQKGDPTPQTQDSPQKEDGKQVQRTSSTAKASTPKRQDQVTTKSTGARSSNKSRQDRDTRQDFGRHQQPPRPRGKRTLPPPVGGRQGSGSGYQGRDRFAPRNAPLGPRDAGVQKVRGRPHRPEPEQDRAPRHGPAVRGYLRNGPVAGSRQGSHQPAGGRPGREVPTESQRPAPAWGRNAPPAREAPPPGRMPASVARRAPASGQDMPIARVPRNDFNQRMLRATARAPGPGRAAMTSGITIGRRVNTQAVDRQSLRAPHTAPPRSRVDRPVAVLDRRLSIPTFAAPPDRFDATVPPPRGANREPMQYEEPHRYSNAALRNERAPRRDAPPPRGNRPGPAAPRGANVRAAPAQPFSPSGIARQQPQQQRGNLRGSAAHVQLPPPRLGPLPGAGPPGLAGDGYIARGGRDSDSHVDRARSRSRGPASGQRGPPYSDRPVSRGRQPAAQQLRAATYPQEQPMPQQYHPADLGPVQTHAPAQHEPHAEAYVPEPHSARRGVPDRAPPGADRYGPAPVARGTQQWQNKPVQAMDVAPAAEYQQHHEPASRDNFGRQGYAPQQRGRDVHMSDARPAQADRRMDRRGRGSRDRADMRRQQDRAPAPVDTGRYPSAREPQGHLEQEYLPGLAPDGYIPRDAPPPSRTHGYPEDQAYMQPQQHVQSGPPRYDSPVGGYAPPVVQDPHQPVYGSGPVAPQGYTTSAAPPVDRQPYYPQQQQPVRQAPVQQQQYADAPQYGREPAYSSGAASYAGGQQGGYMDTPPAQAPRGGYAQNLPVSAQRHRGEEYDPAYPGSGRAQGYAAQARPSPNAPLNHGGVSHDTHTPRGGVRGGGPSQQWAPSPREPSYGGAPHGGSGNFGGQPSQRQGGYSSGPAGWSGNNSRAPQEMYPPQHQVGSGRMHTPQNGYGR